MPNQFVTQEEFSQNGNYSSTQLDLNNSHPKPLSQQSSTPLGQDWSSLTKELIDTFPRVWTRGLLYFLVLFAGIILPWSMLSKVDETGSARGKLRWISPDSKVVENGQGKVEVFELEITLSQAYIPSGKKRITLTPGQTATAEVIVRQRRVIDFVLDPFKKLQKGGLEL